jgi:hypothetical protein
LLKSSPAWSLGFETLALAGLSLPSLLMTRVRRLEGNVSAGSTALKSAQGSIVGRLAICFDGRKRGAKEMDVSQALKPVGENAKHGWAIIPRWHFPNYLVTWKSPGDNQGKRLVFRLP